MSVIQTVPEVTFKTRRKASVERTVPTATAPTQARYAPIRERKASGSVMTAVKGAYRKKNPSEPSEPSLPSSSAGYTSCA